MSIKRKHPIANWLYIEPQAYRSTLSTLLNFRDRAPDPMASGMPEAAVDWFWKDELPRLAKDRGTRLQMERRIDYLTECEIVAGKMPVPPIDEIQAMQQEKLKLELILSRFIKP
jgi:hypothetical protein